MERPNAELAGLALRLGLALAAAIWLALQFGPQYGQLWLPTYRAVIGALMPDYDLASLAIVKTHGDYMISGILRPRPMTLIDGQLLGPDTRVGAYMLLGDVLKHPIVLAVAVLAWPGLNLRLRVERLLLSLPALALLEATDPPLAMASLAYQALSKSAGNHASHAPLLIDWHTLLDGGGRIAFSMAAAVGVAWLHGWLRQQFDPG